MNTVMVNEAATNNMLSGLGNVRVENANAYLNGAGLFVRPHIGRKRIRIAIPKEWLHGDKNDEFRKNNIDAGSITVLPAADEAALQKLESAVRTKARLLAVGMDSKFMPIDVYKNDFRPFFEETKKEYFELRDKLVANWNQIVGDFEIAMHNYLVTLPTYSPELEKGLMASVPTASEFARSFYMDVQLSAFPVVENISILDPAVADELRESTKNQAVNMVYEIMGTILNDVNQTLSEKILEKNAGKEFSGRTTRTLATLRSRITKNNILQHPIVADINRDLGEIISLIESRKGTLRIDALAAIDETVIEKMEEVMVYIFGFANEVGVEIEETEAMPHATLAAMCGIKA
jgi:hypothetical protein